VFVTLDVNDIEEDSYTDETPEAVAKYIVDQLLTSVTAPAGRCYCIFIFVLFLTAKMCS